MGKHGKATEAQKEAVRENIRKHAEAAQAKGINMVELAAKILASFDSEKSTLTVSQWERANLYATAREQFADNKDFGDWISSTFTDASKVDGSNTRAKMIMCAHFLTEDQFKALGMSKAQELMNGKLWESSKTKMKNLVKKAISDNWTVKQCREAVALLSPKPKAANDAESGAPVTGASKTTGAATELEQVKAELERLKALLLSGHIAEAVAIASGEDINAEAA